MKKTISIIVIVAMLLSTVLAIIPMSAAEAEKTNVLFSDAKAADYQFAGKGNVFYYDYHYYVDTLNTFPMTEKGPSLRVGNNSGSGTASATDGKPFAGSMNHSYSDDCAELKLADGSTVKHDHVFGYSFKESVTIDSFKLYVTAGKDGRDDINKVTVYGASVDPAIKYDSYEAGKYYYSTVTELYKMADDADVQANKQTEGDVTAAVVSGDFVAPATVDYILFAVDFNTINAKKYTVLEAEAYGVIGEPEAPEAPEEEEEEVAIDDLLPFVDTKAVDFAGLTFKSLYDGKVSETNFEEVYTVTKEGNALNTVANDKTSGEKSFNLGYVAQTEYAITADSYYVYEFKAKLNRDTGYAGVVFAANGDDHYFVGGAFAADGDHDNADGSRASHVQLYKNKWEGGEIKDFGDQYPVPNLAEEGFGAWRIIYDGLTVYVQYVAKDGNWTYVTDRKTGEIVSSQLPEGSYVAFGAHNRGGNSSKQRTISIKDAVFYDLNTPSIDAIIKLAKEENVDFANLVYKTLYKGAESADKFDEVYNVVIDGSTLTTSAKDTTNNDKGYNLGYVAQTEYAITADSYYVYELKAKLNRDTGYAGFVFAVNGDEHYFAGGAFANDGDHDNADGSRASHIVLYKGDWGTNFNKTFGDHYPVPTAVEDGYGSWRIIYEGLTVKVQYVAKDGNWTYITDDEGNVCSIELPEGSYVAVGAHNRGGAKGKDRTIVIKDAKIYDLNSKAFDKLMEYAAEEDVNFAELTFRTLYDGKVSDKNFAEEYTVTIDGNALNTVANDKTSGTKGDNLGYVAQTEYAITADSYYVYELKAKLNRNTGYAGFVFAVNGDEHYFAGGAFANDGDHDDKEGNQASHLVLYKGKWDTNFNKQFGDHTAIPVLVEDGYGSWRIVYEGLTVKVQYLAKDGNWEYVMFNDEVASIELPEGSYVAVGAHNRGGKPDGQRVINIKDAVIYDLNKIDLNKGVGPAISTPKEFVEALAQGGDFFLLNDIVLPENYVPADFTGSIDGQGFAITLAGSKGLFATLTDASISNLTINGKTAAEGSYGVLADKAAGKVNVTNVTVDVEEVKGSEVAGFIRLTNVKGAEVAFADCKNLAPINGTGKAAGFVAYSNGATVTFKNCQNLASVNGGNDTAGFVADTENTDLTIEDSVNGILGVTQVKGINACGGFVGEGSANVTIINSTNYSLIYDNGTSDWDSTAGGILGMFGNRGSGSAFVAKGVKNYGDLKTRDQWYQGAGGIVGSAKWRDDTKLYFEDTINYGSCVKTGTGPNLGGFVGYTDNGNPIEFIFKNCQNYGDFRSNGNNSGFVGQAGSKNTYFENCQNYGDIRSHNNMAGGFVAWQKHSAITLKDCANYGKIEANSKYAAGLVSGPDCANVIAENCANYGRLIGKTDAAGLVHANGGTLTNCVNYGAITVANANGKLFAIANDKMTIDATCKNEGVVGYTEVATADDFMAMKAGGLYVLVADIVLPTGYKAIDFGAEWYQAELNGNGHTVTLKSDNGASIFNNLASAKIYNVNFKGNSEFAAEGGFVAAKVVGAAKVTFENVNVEAYLTGKANIAGFVGTSDAELASLTFKNCAFEGSVISTAYAAGFAGKLNVHTSNVTFENCTVGSKNEQSAIAGNGRVAAFVAKTLAKDNTSNNTLTFKNCANYATVTGVGNAESAVGSLVGRINRTNLVVDGCANYGDVTSQSTKNTRGVGGLVGEIIYNCNVTITASKNYGDVTTVAGIPGGLIGISSYRSYVTVGALNADGSVNEAKACYNYGNINQTNDWAYGSGGIIGFVKSNSKKDLMTAESTPNEVRVYGAVNYGDITTALSNIGGIVGMTDDNANNVALLEIVGCTNYGDLLATGGNNVGGIGGQTPGTVVKIINCVNNGYVRSINNECGGIYGRSYAGKGALTIDGCVNNGRVEATKWAGGIASGVQEVGTATVTNCVNNGIVVTTMNDAGGVAAIVSCINNGVVSGCTNNGIAAAVTAKQIVRDNWGGAKVENNVEAGAAVSDAALLVKAQSLYGVAHYADAAVYADVVKAFAAAQAVIDNTLVFTHADFVAAEGKSGYAAFAGEHKVGDLTFTLADVMTSNNNTGGIDCIQLKKNTAVLTIKDVTVKKLAIRVVSSYDYTENVGITIGGEALKLADPAVIAAAAVDTGKVTSKGYKLNYFDIVVELDAPASGDLVIKGSSLGAVYFESITLVTADAAAPAAVAEDALDLDALIGKLVNVKALNEALLEVEVNAAKGYADEDYTADTVAALNAALEAAKNAKTQAEVDAAVEAITKAQDAVVYVGALNHQIAAAEALDRVNYTKSTWATLEAALAAAKAVDTKDQEAIDAATAALADAIYNLGDIKAVADLTKKTIAKAEALLEADYTAASWAPVVAAIAAAKESLNSGDADVMDAAVVALEEAMAELIRIAELQAAIAGVADLVAGNYTASSWSALAVALDAAKAALVATNTVTVEKALANLEAAKAALVETTALQAAIADVEALNSADYTAESWADVASALAAAKLALVAADAEGVKAAADALAAAKAALVAYVAVDTSALQSAIADAETLVAGDYTADTWAAFTAALSAAKAALYGEQADVDAAVAALAAAKAALAAKPDVTALEAAIAEIKALVKADYTSATWEALETALAAAKAALKADAQADVDAAVAALAAAKAALVEMPDTAALEAAIAEIKALYAADYTAETWAALADALAAAKAALKAEAQADVDAAVAALAAAKAALEEKPAPVEPEDTDKEDETNKPTEKPTEPVEQEGCGGVIGAAAVVITAVLGLGVTVLKKKD